MSLLFTIALFVMYQSFILIESFAYDLTPDTSISPSFRIRRNLFESVSHNWVNNLEEINVG